MKKVFCVGYAGGHINIIKNVYKELKIHRDVDVTILALTLADAILQKENIPHKTVKDYLQVLPYRDDIIKYGKYCTQGQSLAEGIDELDSIAYHGIGFYDLVQAKGIKEAKKEFEQKGRKAFLPVGAMKKILEEENPSVLLITNSPRMETAAGIAATSLNIPVVRINDLPLMHEKAPYRAKICVMNDWAKNDIIKRQLADETDIVVTGQPVFEGDLKVDNKKVEQYKKGIRGNNFKKVILFLGQGQGSNKLRRENKEALDGLYEFAKQNKSYLVINRPHPNDFCDYKKEYSDLDNFLTKKNGELKYMLRVIDVALTVTSTAGMQAILCGVPLIQTNLTGDFSKKTYLDDISVRANNKEEMIEDIKLLSDKDTDFYKETEKKMQRFSNKKDAAKNVVKVILKEAKE